MKIDVNNLTAVVLGFNTTMRQQADAALEFQKLVKYVDELELTNELKTSNESERVCALNRCFTECEKHHRRSHGCKGCPDYKQT